MKRGVLIIGAILVIALVLHVARANGQEQTYALKQRNEYTLASPRGADPLGPYSLELRLGYKTHDERALFLKDALTTEADAVAMIAEHIGFLVGGSVGQTETDLEAFRPCESCAAIADQTGMDVTMLEGHVGVRAYLTSASSRVKPYLAGGFGGYRFFSDAEDYDGKSAWELYTAAGLHVQLNRGVALAGNFGFNPLQCDLFNRETQADIMSATVGISYSWGGRRTEPERPVRETPRAPTPVESMECTLPRHLDSMQMGGKTYKMWGEWFTPSDGVAWRMLPQTTVMGLPIYVHGGDEMPYEAVFVEACGQFQEFRTEEEVTGTTG